MPTLPQNIKIPVRLPAFAERIRGHLSRTEQAVLGWLILLGLISGIWSIVGFVDRHTELIPQTGGTYTEAAVGQPRYLNPILATRGGNDIDVDISRLVYSSLFKFDSQLNLLPDLATAYETSENDTRYTVHLRNDVTWHDGEHFNADDVLFTIRSIQTPDYGSPLESNFQGVTVEKVDDYTISFKLSNPYAPFLSALTVGVIPEHVWEDIAPNNAPLAEQMLKPVGTGPYQFAERKTRRKTGEITEIHLSRNDQYYGKHQYIDDIIFAFYATHDEAARALTSGQVDGVGFLPLQLLEDVQKHNSLTIHNLKLPQYFALFFNQQRNNLLNDSGIRNALALGTNREEIVKEALQGMGEPLQLPIPPGIFAFNNELGSSSYDPEKAKQNLEEAGWHDVDNDGVREKDDQRLHLAITTTDWPEYVRTAEVIQSQWLKLGIETEIKHFGAGTIQQTIIRPRDYDILLYGQILPAIPDPYPFWHSTQTRSPGLNFSLFKNEQVDKLLEEARKTMDESVRRQKYEEFQGLILELKPALILYRPYYLFAADDNVHGINANNAALTAGRFNNIEDWHVLTKRVWK